MIQALHCHLITDVKAKPVTLCGHDRPRVGRSAMPICHADGWSPLLFVDEHRLCLEDLATSSRRTLFRRHDAMAEWSLASILLLFG